MNAAMSEVALKNEKITKKVQLRLRRYVGDDRIEVYKIRRHLDGKAFDELKHDMFTVVKESGHVINPSKVFVGFGFVEYRQTHGLRGALIPKDQIMLISSEKAKFIDNVQGFLQSYRCMLMTKISRGFSVALIQRIYWYTALIVSKFSLKRYRLISPNRDVITARKMLEDKKMSRQRILKEDIEKAMSTKRQILFPVFYRYCIPGSMNGGSIHPHSILLSMMESELGYLIELFGNNADFLAVLRSWKKFRWYSVEAVPESVNDFFRAADPKFLNELTSSSTHATREVVKEYGIQAWWPDIPRELVARSMKMEKRLMGRDFRGAEYKTLLMIISLGKTTGSEVSNHEIALGMMQNSGYVIGLHIVAHLEKESVIEKYTSENTVSMDIFLDTPALLFRMHCGYGSVNMGIMGKLGRYQMFLSLINFVSF